ncbi:RdgB/HAM1 family non-canonical purine NTP pyrophosphatase [Candidatus Kaiserbacteria bacterium]|nr:RdgB/HAM1 family non-canonical purine NTP pyrophosphatase [Candidatus Kaiserbacteria bacterium]
MKKLLIATRSAGKLPEMKSLLAGLPFDLYGVGDIPELFDFDVEEVGHTFEENAIIKAKGFGEKTGLLALADDSGLEVDILHGRPGIRSARYAPGSDSDRYLTLLKEMENARDGERGAQFYSAVAVYEPGTGRVATTNGICRGRILYEPKGERGFGYDPIFFADDLGKTFAEATLEEKQSIDHRGKAMAKMREVLLRDFV